MEAGAEEDDLRAGDAVVLYGKVQCAAHGFRAGFRVARLGLESGDAFEHGEHAIGVVAESLLGAVGDLLHGLFGECSGGAACVAVGAEQEHLEEEVADE